MCVAFVSIAALGAGHSCPDGYTSDAGAATINQCYKSISAGSYWDGDEIKTCPAGSACGGGKMPYESRGTQWGITTCSRSWSGPGSAVCNPCPIDPLTGERGNWEIDNTSPYGCWHPVAVDAGMNIGCNAQTTATANCYWNGQNYALGGDNIYGCDAYHIYACAAGYADGGPGLSSQNQCAAKCENRAVENGHILPNSATAAYPAKCEYNASNTVCDNGYKLTASNVCAPICTGGITKLRAGNVSAPPVRHTTNNARHCHSV